MAGGLRFGIRPVGMLALDVARVEAGLLLIDVDFHEQQEGAHRGADLLPFELGLGRLVQLDKRPFVGRAALGARSSARARKRQIVGLGDRTGRRSSGCTSSLGMPPQMPLTASRVAVPVYKDGRQIGRATTTTWSPVLKKLIALATHRGATFHGGHAGRVRDHRRRGPPPRARHRRRDAVFQPAAERPRRRPHSSSHERVAVVARRTEVLLHGPGADPAHQIQLRAGLVVGARGPRAAERLLTDHRAGRLVVDVEVAGGITQRRGRLDDRPPILERRRRRSARTATSRRPAPASRATRRRRTRTRSRPARRSPRTAADSPARVVSTNVGRMKYPVRSSHSPPATIVASFRARRR